MDCLSESRNRLLLVPGSVSFPGPQKCVERRRIASAAHLDFRRYVPEQIHLEGTRNSARNLGLELQHIAEIAVVGLGPEVKSRDRIDQLRRDAHGVARAPDASLEYRADIQFARDRPDIGVLSLEGERRSAGRDL